MARYIAGFVFMWLVKTLRKSGLWFALLSAVVTVFVSLPAMACMGPHTRMFPICELAAPRADERVSVVYTLGGRGLSSVTFDSDNMVTEVVDVKIGKVGKPHYIALSSGKPVIWRFIGAANEVSRVVVLGSQFAGAGRSGVVGIAKEHVLFARPDLQQLKKVGWNSCLSVYRACELSAYFNVSKAARMKLAGKPPSSRYEVDQFIERTRAGTVNIPGDGWVEVKKHDQRNRHRPKGPVLGRHEWWGGTGTTSTSQIYERGIIQIEENSVVSLKKVRKYGVLPAKYGIRQHLASGSLLGPEAPEFKTFYRRWIEKISKPYRSKLDPDFSYPYKIDYLITRPIKVPAALEKTVFLVAENVNMTDFSSLGQKSCLFFADQRKLKIDRRKQRDPSCEKAILALSKTSYSLGGVVRSLARQKHISESERKQCRMMSLPKDAYFAAVTLSEGRQWRPGAMDTSRRRVDLIVKHPGKVALFLDMFGGRTDWHIRPSRQTHIVSVILQNNYGGERADTVKGIEPSVPVRSLRGGDVSKAVGYQCMAFSPTSRGFFEGPTILQLNSALKVLTGR